MYSNMNVLPMRTSGQVTKRSLQRIKANKDGEELFFKTRFDKVNKALLGGFRFGNYAILAGASGHGKSYLLAEFVEDFLDPELNPTEEDVKILCFGFDMPAESEITRSLAAQVNTSYGTVMSAETPLSDEQFEIIEQIAEEKYANRQVYYVDKPGTKEDIKHTVYAFRDRFPDARLIVTLDHSLLVEYGAEKTEIELVSKVSKTMKALRQELGILIVMLSQLNDKIEDPRRRDPSLHYPTKTDIHGSKAVYQDADIVMVLHQPQKLGIENYGRKQYPAKNLAALHVLKNRDMHGGLVLLKEDLAHARFLPYQERYGL